MTSPESIMSKKISLTNFWNAISAHLRPNGMRRNSNCPWDDDEGCILCNETKWNDISAHMHTANNTFAGSSTFLQMNPWPKLLRHITIGAPRPFMIPKPRTIMIIFLEKDTVLPQDTCETLAYQNGLCAD